MTGINVTQGNHKFTPMNGRIALFLPSLRGGGAERVMVTLANGIAERGYSVDLVLAEAIGPFLGDVSNSVRVVDLGVGRVIKAVWPLVRYLRRERPVAMLSALNHANLVAILAKSIANGKIRLVISEHNTISTTAEQASGFSARVVNMLVPKLYPMADAIVAVSANAARDLEQFADLPAGTVHAIYNPFDLNRIQRLATEEVPHPWLQLSETRPVILAIGRLTEQKDFPTLIRAFAAMRKRSSARLLILGEGHLRGELAALAQTLGLEPDEFQMPGFVTNPFAYLAKAALFVLSSRWEGLPSVLIEAMSCGTPVVSTDCPSGPREILQDGRWGRLVPVGDEDALARAIEDALEQMCHPDVAARAAEFGVDRAVDGYLRVMLGRPL